MSTNGMMYLWMVTNMLNSYLILLTATKLINSHSKGL